MNYKRLLIQQYTQDGTTYTNVGNVVDTLASYGVACQEFPFKLFPETKDLPKHDWNDEDGEDVYMPEDGLRFKAYDIEAKFLYTCTDTVNPTPVQKDDRMRQQIGDFIKFICGRIGTGTQGGNPSPLLKIYDEYTRTGRRGVYVLSIDNELYFYNDSNIDAIAVFKVKFRVTDPVFEVTYNNGALNG